MLFRSFGTDRPGKNEKNGIGDRGQRVDLQQVIDRKLASSLISRTSWRAKERFMDHNSQFRRGFRTQGSPRLGPNKQRHLPVSNSPGARPSRCSQNANRTSARHPASASDAVKTHSAPDSAEGNPQVDAQVKQLQFWLKVFSRFCQEEPERE